MFFKYLLRRIVLQTLPWLVVDDLLDHFVQFFLIRAFFANGDFTGGTTEAQNDKQLVIYGSVAADAELNGSGSVNTQRDLGNFNSTSPAVAFIWNPFLILNAPQPFTDAVMDWKEVAP